MNDGNDDNNDLERMLKRSGRSTSKDPRLHVGPRVRGGPPLQGGPKLEMDQALGSKSNSEPPQTGTSEPVGAIPSLGGPHIPITDTRPRTNAGRHFAPQKTGNEVQLEACNLKKSFHKGKVTIPVLRGVDLHIRRGEFLAVVGQSGSGKSTLLHLLGVLDAPDAGEIRFEGRRVDNLPGFRRDRLRNNNLGMIFQFYHLLPELSMLENVLVPLMITESTWGFLRNRHKYRARATQLLQMVGLGHRLKHKPRELSGGEMQRTAIARALVTDPDVLLADEPTGNLDHQTGREILKILRRLNGERNLTIVMVTHDQTIAEEADRVVRLIDGWIQRA